MVCTFECNFTFTCSRIDYECILTIGGIFARRSAIVVNGATARGYCVHPSRHHIYPRDSTHHGRNFRCDLLVIATIKPDIEIIFHAICQILEIIRGSISVELRAVTRIEAMRTAFHEISYNF